VKALSIKQPWAWAITDLDKRIENRSMSTRHRGEVFLHASAQGDSRGMGALWDLLTDAEKQAAPEHAPSAGAIVGVASIVGCLAPPPGTEGRTCEPGQQRWAERASHWWLLHNVIKLPAPVPCRGMLGLWTVPPDVEAAVRRQLTMPRKPKAESPKPIAEPAPNSPEDLGYSKTKGKKPLLKPEEREEVLRLSQIIAEAKRDTVRFAEAKKAAGEPLKEAKARLAKAIDQLDAVESGNWQPGMFTDGEVDGDGAGDENE